MSHLYVLLGGILFKECFNVHSLGLFQNFNRDRRIFPKQLPNVGTSVMQTAHPPDSWRRTVPSAELLSIKTLPPA